MLFPSWWFHCFSSLPQSPLGTSSLSLTTVGPSWHPGSNSLGICRSPWLRQCHHAEDPRGPDCDPGAPSSPDAGETDQNHRPGAGSVPEDREHLCRASASLPDRWLPHQGGRARHRPQCHTLFSVTPSHVGQPVLGLSTVQFLIRPCYVRGSSLGICPYPISSCPSHHSSWVPLS